MPIWGNFVVLVFWKFAIELIDFDKMDSFKDNLTKKSKITFFVVYLSNLIQPIWPNPFIFATR